jgi:hypothetical protein
MAGAMLTDGLARERVEGPSIIGRMHLVVSHAASSSEAGRQALQSLQLPNLESLLARLQPGPITGTDENSLNPPHEQVLAQLQGWPPRDGRLPFAAALARADGIDVADTGQGWGLVTPAYWELGREQIVLTDPAALGLEQDESRALWQAVRGLFDSDGWSLHWGAPLRWYTSHPSLAELPTAALDRVIGSPIDAWLPDRMAGAPLRRLQAEVQMLLYTHPINAAREQRGAWPVNSFWLSGTGKTQAARDLGPEVVFDDSLRAPLLAHDWMAWAQGWQRLDTTRVADLQACAQRGEDTRLTLCGERRAQRFDDVPRSAWQRLSQRWARADLAPLLQAL